MAFLIDEEFSDLVLRPVPRVLPSSSSPEVLQTPGSGSTVIMSVVVIVTVKGS